ncbi:hypothetical protein D3C79_462480 [compost metagenome]
MRPVLPQRLDVGDAQLFAGDAHAPQAEILGDGVVFAVPCALDQCLHRRGPIIDLAPQVDILDIAQLLVEEAVDHLQSLKLSTLLLRGHQVLPGIDPALPGTQGAIQGLRLAADLGKVPIRVQAAQQQAAKQHSKADTLHNGFEHPGYRHCEALFRPVESSDGAACHGKRQWHPAIMHPPVTRPTLSGYNLL